jgi:hypothetical protein
VASGEKKLYCLLKHCGVSHRMAKLLSLKKTITTYPMLFGAFIGLLLVIGIFSMVIWDPWIGDAWEKHNKLVQAIFLTTFNFVVFVNVLWGRRRRGAFWIFSSG